MKNQSKIVANKGKIRPWLFGQKLLDTAIVHFSLLPLCLHYLLYPNATIQQQQQWICGDFEQYNSSG